MHKNYVNKNMTYHARTLNVSVFTLFFILQLHKVLIFVHSSTKIHCTAALKCYVTSPKNVEFIPASCCLLFQLPHHAVFREHFKFLKAHEAEGLLGVCIFLIKVSISTNNSVISGF